MPNLRTASDDTTVPDDFVLLGADSSSATSPSKYTAQAASEAVAKKAFSLLTNFSGDPTTAFIPLVDASGNLIGRTALQEFADPFTEGTPPGTIRNTLLAASQPGITIPIDGLGVHSREVVSGQVPTYNAMSTRSHDASVLIEDRNEMFPAMWMDGTGGSAHNWAFVDPWINYFDSLGKSAMVTWMGTHTDLATDYAVTKYGTGEQFASISFFGPDTPSTTGAGVAALVARHGAKIESIDVWNEPNFGYNGPIDPAVSTYLNQGHPSTNGFCFMTAQELAEVGYQIKANAGSIPVIGPGWEGQEMVHLGSNVYADPSLTNNYSGAVAYYTRTNSGGNYAAEDTDEFGIHTYVYDVNNTQKIIFEIRGYFKIRDWLIANYGMDPNIKTRNTEIGCEQGAVNASNILKGTAVARACMINWSLGVTHCYLYRHSEARVLGDPHNNTSVAALYQQLANSQGKTVRQAVDLTDNRIWMRFSDNSELLI